MRDGTGAPILPQGIQASISHKQDIAVCVAKTGDRSLGQIGIDVEVSQPRPVDIASRVLTENER